MDTLDVMLDRKSVAEDGTIEGIAAAFGNVDHGGDMMIPGAFTKSLGQRRSLPMLLFHDQQKPVGVWSELRETSDGLLAKGRFAVSTTSGKDAHAMAREGALGGLSIGYLTTKQRHSGKTRELHEVSLHEISLVSVPMNDRAVITSVKAILEEGNLPSLSEFEDFLRDAGGFSRTQAAAIAGKGLRHLLSQREAGREVDEPAKFLRALLANG